MLREQVVIEVLYLMEELYYKFRLFEKFEKFIVLGIFWDGNINKVG